MKKYFLFLFSAILFSIGLYAQTNIGTNFTVNTTLTVANSPYTVTNNVNINEGVTVTVEKDVVIKFNSGRYFQVIGTLNAKGATFTSSSSTPAKGNWDGIYVSYTSYNPGSVTLDSCIVEYAGNIYCRNGQLTLRKTILNSFSGYGIQVEGKGTVNIQETTIKNTNYPIYFTGAGMLKSGGNNLLTGNSNDYILVNGFNDITGNFDLPNLDVPYYMGTIRVTETGNLAISPGVQLRFMNSEFTVRGKIKALGTADKPIIFEMHPGASYYLGVNITASAIDTACVFKNCIFRNAVYNSDSYSAMEINAASPTFENCKFTNNCRNLMVTGISQPVFTNCVFDPSTLLSGESYNVAMDMNTNLDMSSDSIKFNANELRTIRILPSTVINDAQKHTTPTKSGQG